MGNCVSSSGAQNNVFRVKNINDSKDLVQQGLMEVTDTELVYIDKTTKDEWHWPLKYLRKYGCDGDVFTFEAGRKCTGGEGLYAFSTRKASVLFELVAKNINLGESNHTGESLVSSEQPPEVSMLNFPPKKTSVSSPGKPEQPSYTNIDISPVANGDLSSATNQDSTTPNPVVNKFVYREVVFEKPAEEHPKPLPATKRTTSYTQIDFQQTMQFNKEKQAGVTSPLSSTQAIHTQKSSTLTNGSSGHHHRRHHHHNGGSRSGAGRSRIHTYSGSSKDPNVSRSESSIGSQSSLTESSRDVRHPAKANGGVMRGAASSPDANSSLYQNVQIGGGGALQEQQQQYQNVSIGTGSVDQVFDSDATTSPPPPQPNYCNINVSLANSGSHDQEANSGSVKLNGHMVRSHAHSVSSTNPGKSSAVPPSSYLQLNFPAEHDPSHLSVSDSVQEGRRSSSMGAITTAQLEQACTSNPSIIHQHIPEEEVGVASHIHRSNTSSDTPVIDETRVSYGVLNFTTMKALSDLSSQREKEIEKEKEQRDREKTSSTSSGKKRK